MGNMPVTWMRNDHIYRASMQKNKTGNGLFTSPQNPGVRHLLPAHHPQHLPLIGLPNLRLPKFPNSSFR
jgi:hypothetical protein